MKKFVFAGLIGSTLLLSGCFSESIESQLQKAEQAVEKRQCNTARVYARNVLQEEPVNATAKRVLGQCDYLSGRYPQAIKLLEQAQHGKGWRLPLAWSYLRNRQFQKVTVDISPGPNMSDSQKGELYAVQSIAFVLTDNDKQANNKLQQAKQLLGDKAPVISLATAYRQLQQKKPEVALGTLKTLLARHPSYLEAWLIKGNLEQALGQPLQSLDSYRTALDLYPDNLNTRRAVIGNLLMINRSDEALAAIAKLPGAQQEPLLLYWQAIAHYQQGDLQQAATILNPLLGQLNEFIPGYVLAAQLNMRLKQYDQANHYLEALLANPRTTDWARRNLAQIQLDQGQYQNAVNTLKPIREQLKETPIGQGILAELALHKGDYKQAKKLLEQAIEAQPLNTRWRNQMALTLLTENPNDQTAVQPLFASNVINQQLDNYRRQAEQAQLLPAEAIRNPNHLLNASNDFTRVAQNEETLKLAKTLAKKHPEALNIQLLLAILYREQQQTDQALQVLNQLSQQHGDNIDVWMQLAVTQAMNDDKIAAEQSLQKLIAIKPDYLPAWRYRLRLAETTDQRLQIAKSIQKHFPDNPYGYLVAANLEWRQNDRQEALKTARSAAKVVQQNPQSVRLLSRMLWHSNERAEAIAVLKPIQEANPNDFITFLQLARFLLLDDQMDDFRQLVSTMDNKEFSGPVPLNELALLYQEAGQMEQAVKRARQAYRLAPGNPSIMDTLGWILVNHQQAEEGWHYLRQAHDLAPEDPVITYHLAEAYLSLGYTQEGRDLLQQALKSDRPFAKREQAEQRLANLPTTS